jgi:sulfur carrier protein ThiS
MALHFWQNPNIRQNSGMNITFKLHASLRDFLPADAAHHRTTVNIDVPEGSTVQNVIDHYALPSQQVHLVLVDGVYLHKDQRLTRMLKAGEALAIWPPIAGG